MPWPLPEGEAERLALAKGYPFPAPDASFLFRDGSHRALTTAQAYDSGLFAGRTPVIAHGSNRSPEQLARKYGAAATIPVTRGWLADYDVVYSAHITQYGAVASTLHYVPGARARISINWLDETQLARMHETEGPSNYQYGEMAGIILDLEAGPATRLERAWIYFSKNGCLARDGAPIGIAAVEAESRPHDALPQEATLEHVRTKHRPESDVDAMILRAIADKGYRQSLVEEMRAEAVPARAPHFDPDAVEPIDESIPA